MRIDFDTEFLDIVQVTNVCRVLVHLGRYLIVLEHEFFL